MIDRWSRVSRVVVRLCVTIGVAVAPTITPAADGPAPPSFAALPAIDQLPNPFLCRDGSPVMTPVDWERRRVELKGLFEEYEYGHLPPRPERWAVTRTDPTVDAEGQVARQVWNVTLGQGDRSLVMRVRLAWPAAAREPLPVVVRLSLPRPDGSPIRPDDSKIYLDRGYALVEVNAAEVAADGKKAREGGIYKLFGDGIDAGCLMAWAWGVHRVVDAIEGDERLDPKRIIVTGHSRFGKAAIVAGAFDERIALTAPSHSGCGGTAPFRFLYGKSEALGNIVGMFPYWFRPDFARFIGEEKRLPVDQHELRALVAPRGFLTTEGTKDAWSNPEGSQLAHQAALRVYRFLGAPDRIAIKFRPIGHDVTSVDVVDFADHLFLGKPLPDDFRKMPYPEATTAFSWEAPVLPRTTDARP